MTASSIRISETAIACGFGSDTRKYVCRLSAQDKAHLDQGGTLIVTGCPGHLGGRNNNGITFREVYRDKTGRARHRVPSAEVISEIEKI